MATAPWDGEIPSRIRQAFPEIVCETLSYLGQNFVTLPSASAVPVLAFLKDETGFDYLADVTAVDYPAREKRFDLIYVVYSFPRNERIRLKCQVALGERPATAVPVHLTANWLEREVFDMFGIEFDGHPNMTRILMPEEWNGYPLRKDYGILDQDQAWVRENLRIESGQ